MTDRTAMPQDSTSYASTETNALKVDDSATTVVHAQTPEILDLGSRPRKRNWSRLVTILGIVVLAGVALSQSEGLRDQLTPERVSVLRSLLGIWAPLVGLVWWTLGVVIWLPASLLLFVSTLFLDTGAALAVNYLGALLGAQAAFYFARLVGSELLTDFLLKQFPHFQGYHERLSSRGFETALILRLIPLPFTAMSYLLSLGPLKGRTHFGATALAILPGIFALTLGLGGVMDALQAREWGALLSWKLLLCTLLYVPALLAPRLIRRIEASRSRKEDAAETGPVDA